MTAESQKPEAFAAFAGVLGRWETERLQQAAKDVKALTSHPGYLVLFEVLREKQAKEIQRLIHSDVLEHARMTAITGTLSGLDQVLHVADAVVYAAEHRDEQEREAAQELARREASTA